MSYQNPKTNQKREFQKFNFYFLDNSVFTVQRCQPVGFEMHVSSFLVNLERAIKIILLYFNCFNVIDNYVRLIYLYDDW